MLNATSVGLGKLTCPWKCVGNEVLEDILPIENGDFFQPAMTEPYIFEQKHPGTQDLCAAPHRGGVSFRGWKVGGR